MLFYFSYHNIVLSQTCIILFLDMLTAILQDGAITLVYRTLCLKPTALFEPFNVRNQECSRLLKRSGMIFPKQFCLSFTSFWPDGTPNSNCVMPWNRWKIAKTEGRILLFPFSDIKVISHVSITSSVKNGANCYKPFPFLNLIVVVSILRLVLYSIG